MNNTNLQKTDVTPEELEKINHYSVKELKAEDVYVFSVKLCDNDTDRDFERFSDSALEQMAPMFIGKTAISDHAMKSENQVARTFDAFVEEVAGKKNAFGEPYKVLKAKAYMPRTEKNAPLIEEIESGIKKEVSVSCSVKKRTCSVCGKDMNSGKCVHTLGKSYAGKMCSAILSDVSDVYEWSFVAVPAQKQAGVTAKSFGFKIGEFNMIELKKAYENIGENADITLKKNAVKEILDYIEGLEEKANGFDEYKTVLAGEVTKLCGVALPEMENDNFKNIANKLSVEELMSFKKAFSKKANEIMPLTAQLSGEQVSHQFDNKEFNI